MKATSLLIFSALLVVLPALAQTKRISTLSHSGKVNTITIKTDGNFGLGPEMFRLSEKQWDSIRKADSLRTADTIRKPQTGAKHPDAAKPQRTQSSNAQAGNWLAKATK